MANVALKISIAGRTYPLTVKKEEEQRVLATAEMINEKIKEFEQSYSVHDKQDLLAMCALNLLASQQNAKEDSELNNDLINQLDMFVSAYLQKEQQN